jgi:hypothetical protein
VQRPRSAPMSCSTKSAGGWKWAQSTKRRGLDSEYGPRSSDHQSWFSPGVGGESSCQRFRQERQILRAASDTPLHRASARRFAPPMTANSVHRHGSYIEASGITDYCHGRHVSFRRARLELFCRCVRRPRSRPPALHVTATSSRTNILIARAASTKLLDFGIASLLPFDGQEPELPLTQSMALLTPPTMRSPDNRCSATRCRSWFRTSILQGQCCTSSAGGIASPQLRQAERLVPSTRMRSAERRRFPRASPRPTRALRAVGSPAFCTTSS